MGILNHPILKRIITIIIVVLLLVFIGYQIWRANHSSVVTETAAYASISDTIQAEGVIIRDETLVQQNTAGVITYHISDGTKIAKDGLIATVYDTAEDATTQQRREQLESQLATLKELNSARTTTTYTNPDNLDKDIHTKLYTLLESIHERDRGQIDSDKDSVLKSINTRQITTGQVTDFNAKIQSLQSQLTSLGSVKGTKKGEITSPSSGYFVSSTDGYESTFHYDDATKLTVDDLKTPKDQKTETQDSNVIGKICNSYNWYVACIVPADTATRLKEDTQVSIQLPFVSSGDIPATVAAVNQIDDASEAAVILRCNYMSDTLSKVRDETIQIHINTYTGIRVSQQSVRFQTVSKEVTDENGNTTTVTKEVKGVYILYGNSIKFVEIVPLYSSNNYVICNPNPDTSELMTNETLTLYDEVVVGGKDLYDGKMVK